MRSAAEPPLPFAHRQGSIAGNAHDGRMNDPQDVGTLARDAHLHPAAALAARLGVDPREGLRADEALKRQAFHGCNSLPESPPRSLPRRVLDQFRDFMVLVLIAAALLSGFIGDVADTVAIGVIVVLNAAIGLAQEWRAERALDALKR